DPKNVTKTINDGLGRVIESRQYEDGNSAGNNYISTKRTYDAMGRVSQVSNPSRPTETVAWTSTQYDWLGRVVQVTNPDSTLVTTGYRGNTATTRDPSDRWRQTTTDALGRATQVLEDPTATISIIIPPSSSTTNYSHTSSFGSGLSTAYTYDLLDDLKTVSQ